MKHLCSSAFNFSANFNQSGMEGNGNDFVMLIQSASPLAKFVLLVLIAFSIFSWAVIIFKLWEYGRARKSALAFQQYFRKNRNFTDIYKNTEQKINNPLYAVFKYGFQELSLQKSGGREEEPADAESLQRALWRASNAEIVRLERLNGFLATTASVTPYIGLFGTVWGIMHSFQAIGLQMNVSLATVAPGIAEALIATALGLFAAIPASIFYNLLLNKLKVIISMMEDFSLDFLNLCVKIN